MFGQVGGAYGHYRKEEAIKGISAILLVPILLVVFKLGLSIRDIVAQKSAENLSQFLCNSILAKGTAVICSLTFFTFETVSCIASQDNFEGKMCVNSSMASLCLSIYLVILATLSIARSAMKKEVQDLTSVTFDDIATLKNLAWWQKLQGWLMIITTLCAMIMLSFVGVEGEPDPTVDLIGLLGVVPIGIAALIGMGMIAKTNFYLMATLS